jgi:hypothetical protein
VLNGDTHPSNAELVRQCLQFHFRADVDSPPTVQKQIISVLRRTADGLAGRIQLSDALNRYVWDLYEVYLDGLTLMGLHSPCLALGWGWEGVGRAVGR